MVKSNPHIRNLSGNYLFPEVKKRALDLLHTKPDAKLIFLSIGDTTEAIPPSITQSMVQKAIAMGTDIGYEGYGKEQGLDSLRKLISETYYKGLITPEEVFVADGAKCDIARLQMLFGGDVVTAVQDPSYPVYVDTSVIIGQAGSKKGSYYDRLVYLPCVAENNFFPQLNDQTPPFDLLYFCNPNNPTGAICTKEQLTELVSFVRKRGAFLIYDAAYSVYIQEDAFPRTIFEIPGAKDVAIEINSFSKIVGFTGLRLSWTVVPKDLFFEDGYTVITDWNRIMTTCFNGPSIITQHGGLAALSSEGLKSIKMLVQFYMDNAMLLKDHFTRKDYTVFGGTHAPYLFLKTQNMSSWEAFDYFLHKYNIVTTPGSGFGPSGEGYLRLSAFGKRATIEEALQRLK